MELRQLRTFQAVARLLSFNRAAEALNYAQSTVSAQIRLLEEELGVPLFDRLGKRVRLTEAGRVMARYSQKMIDLEKETRTRISGAAEPRGAISLRVPQSIVTYFLPGVLKRFAARFPGVGFDIGVCAYDTLVHELKTGIIDLAFLLTDSLPFQELKAELLGIEKLVAVSGPDHRLAALPVVETADFARETIFLPKHDCSYKMTFERMLAEEKVAPATFMEMNSIEAVKQCVMAGIGVAMAPAMAVADEIREKKLARLAWPEEGLETGILMIRHRNKWVSPMLGTFMELAREEITRVCGRVEGSAP